MYCKECGHEVSEGDFCAHCGASLVQSEHTKYAGFWIRFAAYFIDGIIIGIPIGVIAFILGIFSIMSSNEPSTSAYEGSLLILDIFLYLGSLMISILYYAGMNASKWQGTLGKMIVGIQITDLNGQRISFGRALGRFFATILSSIFYIGYIMAAFTKKKQSLHDFIAGTVVVYKK
jgi:uncharacterized RDD family membrane protein YckC